MLPVGQKGRDQLKVVRLELGAGDPRSTGAEPESLARNRLSWSQLIELPARAINTVSIKMASITCSAITNLADLEISASDVGP